MRVKKFISLTVMLLMISAYTVTQQAAAQTPPTVKHVPAVNTPSNSGKTMFSSYCAVCHGTDGKGNGPAASAMKTPPIDLTLLTQKNGGKYPSAHVVAVLHGQAGLASHGTADMPIWGPIFSSISHGSQAQVQQRIANLATYVETLQAK